MTNKRIARAKRLTKARNIRHNNTAKKAYRWVEMPKLESVEAKILGTACEQCAGTGVISFNEQVYANEPHMADTGTMPCPMCAINKEIEE